MATKFKIELTGESKKVVENLQQLPIRMVQQIALAMQNENAATVSHIQHQHLNGTGPFPPEQHKLGQRTSRLIHSVNATKPVIHGEQVDSSIGSNVIYAAIHEFGGRIHKPEHQQKIRLRTDARGNLVRQLGKLAIFARAGHQRARESTVTVKAYDITMPERAPFRTGISERAQNYSKSISAAIIGVWNGQKK